MLAVTVSATSPPAHLLSPTERIRDRSCAHKIGHATRRAAKHAARSMHAGRGERGRLHAYRCAFCDRWHVGHSCR
jgi:hypothetical protein